MFKPQDRKASKATDVSPPYVAKTPLAGAYTAPYLEEHIEEELADWAVARWGGAQPTEAGRVNKPTTYSSVHSPARL